MELESPSPLKPSLLTNFPLGVPLEMVNREGKDTETSNWPVISLLNLMGGGRGVGKEAGWGGRLKALGGRERKGQEQWEMEARKGKRSRKEKKG